MVRHPSSMPYAREMAGRLFGHLMKVLQNALLRESETAVTDP